MWLIPFTVGDKHVLRIDLGKPQRVAGVRACGVHVSSTRRDTDALQVRLWNYNKSAEDVRRGVKAMRLVIDGVPVAEPVPVRKAPGCSDFDFGQNVFLQVNAAGSDKDAGVSLRCQSHQDAVPAGFDTRPDVFRRRLDRVNQDFETPVFRSGSLFKVCLSCTSAGTLPHHGVGCFVPHCSLCLSRHMVTSITWAWMLSSCSTRVGPQ